MASSTAAECQPALLSTLPPSTGIAGTYHHACIFTRELGRPLCLSGESFPSAPLPRPETVVYSKCTCDLITYFQVPAVAFVELRLHSVSDVCFRHITEVSLGSEVLRDLPWKCSRRLGLGAHCVLAGELTSEEYLQRLSSEHLSLTSCHEVHQQVSLIKHAV